MNEYRIILGNFDNARKLCELANECSFDIDLKYRNVVVDAKSILGVLSIDLRNKALLCFDGENEELSAFASKLEKAAQHIA